MLHNYETHKLHSSSNNSNKIKQARLGYKHMTKDKKYMYNLGGCGEVF